MRLCRRQNHCLLKLSRLQNCPMCRGYIQSYFLLGAEPSQQDETSVSSQQHSYRYSALHNGTGIVKLKGLLYSCAGKQK